MDVFTAQGFEITCRLCEHLIPVDRKPARQGHNLVPAIGRLARIHVKDDDDAATSVGCGGRSVNASRAVRTKVEFGPMGDDELISFGVVVAEEILSAAHVTEEEEDMSVSDRPEVGTGAVIADHREAVVLHERMEILPVLQIFGSIEPVGANRFARRAVRECPPG